jgi:hypothetical protein
MSWLRTFLPLSALALIVLGCAARHEIQPAFASNNSGINGQLVSTSSGGGGVQASGAAQGTVKVTTADKTLQVATVDTDPDGNFQIGLRPGSYFVYTEPVEGMLFGRRVAVQPSQTTHLELRLPPQ